MTVRAIPRERCRRVAVLSGPISRGDQALNLRAFREARDVLRAERLVDGARLAWTAVLSPTDLPGTAEAAAESAALIRAGMDYREGPLYKAIYRECLRQVLEADVLFLLPGWGGTAAEGEAWLAQAAGIEARLWHPDPRHRRPLTTTRLSVVARGSGPS